MITTGLHWGKNSLETAYARGLAIDPYPDYVDDLHAVREYLNLGRQTYLHSNRLPPNSTWWYGDWHDGEIRLQRNLSGGVYEILAPPPFFGDVTTFRGRATANAYEVRADNYKAWEDPTRQMVASGNVPLNVQPNYEPPAPWWDFGGYGGGFEDWYGV